MKLNLVDGVFINHDHPAFLPASRIPDVVCGRKAPEWPHYECTRKPGHDGDHAAHGVRVEPNPIPMYARWSRMEVSAHDVSGDGLYQDMTTDEQEVSP